MDAPNGRFAKSAETNIAYATVGMVRCHWPFLQGKQPRAVSGQQPSTILAGTEGYAFDRVITARAALLR